MNSQPIVQFYHILGQKNYDPVNLRSDATNSHGWGKICPNSMKENVSLLFRVIWLYFWFWIQKPALSAFSETAYRHHFHEVRALRALMHAARALRENGDDMKGDKNWIVSLRVPDWLEFLNQIVQFVPLNSV